MTQPAPVTNEAHHVTRGEPAFGLVDITPLWWRRIGRFYESTAAVTAFLQSLHRDATHPLHSFLGRVRTVKLNVNSVALEVHFPQGDLAAPLEQAELVAALNKINPGRDEDAPKEATPLRDVPAEDEAGVGLIEDPALLTLEEVLRSISRVYPPNRVAITGIEHALTGLRIAKEARGQSLFTRLEAEGRRRAESEAARVAAEAERLRGFSQPDPWLPVPVRVETTRIPGREGTPWKATVDFSKVLGAEAGIPRYAATISVTDGDPFPAIWEGYPRSGKLIFEREHAPEIVEHLEREILYFCVCRGVDEEKRREKLGAENMTPETYISMVLALIHSEEPAGPDVLDATIFERARRELAPELHAFHERDPRGLPDVEVARFLYSSKLAREMLAKNASATPSGLCPRCTKRFEKGDAIALDEKGAYVHGGCGKPAAPPIPLAPNETPIEEPGPSIAARLRHLITTIEEARDEVNQGVEAKYTETIPNFAAYLLAEIEADFGGLIGPKPPPRPLSDLNRQRARE